jgi:signal transduction histidine kinase
MNDNLRILILEDVAADTQLMEDELNNSGITFISKRVATKKDYLDELNNFSPDLILSDYNLPQYSGTAALAEAKSRCPDIPFILVTGALGEERAIDILTHGANDYVMKSGLQRLAPAVHRALGEAAEIAARKKAEAELRKLRDNLRSLTMEVTLAEEKERRRIALELHDHVSQNLAYCRIKLGELVKENKSSPLVQSINELLNIVTETIADTRSLTFELSPPVLYELGLEQAIEWLGQKVIAGRDINFRLDNDDQLAQISQELKILLFQIVRELLNNVAKHAQAKETQVIIRKTGDNILIDVQDDGIGFDVSRITDYSNGPVGFGLFSIRERLNHIGGDFHINSSPTGGAKVSISVPISV